MPTFSEITIAFDTDWEIGDSLILKTDTSGTINVDTWDWVATRSAGFEVTEGTPTGNAGETSAINFKAAFDLDYPTGYVTAIQNTNEVLIQSETEGEDFVNIRVEAGNVGTFTVTFSNYVVPPDNSNVDLILTRSPHYVNTPFYSDTTTKVTISLYVWEGDIGTVPATVTQTLTIIRPTIDYAEANTDLSNVIRSYLDVVPSITTASVSQITNNSTNGLKWVYYSAVYTDPSSSPADIVGTLGASDGYGLYSEGVNPTRPTSRVLTDVTYRKVASNGVILLPFIADGTITSIDVDTEGGEVNATHAITATDESTEFVRYVCIDCSQITTDKIITVDLGTPVVEYEITDECRYNPKTVIFKNRYGVYDTLTLFKKSNETLSVDREMFNNNYISAGTYDTEKHQFHDINIKSTKIIRLNSGYIDEDENTLYEQLLNSDKVYFYESGTLVPVNIKTSSLEFKTRVNDRLVNYQLEFGYSYNEIQNV